MLAYFCPFEASCNVSFLVSTEEELQEALALHFRSHITVTLHIPEFDT